TGLSDGVETSPTYNRFAYGGEATKTGNLKHFPVPVFLTSQQQNKGLDFASISNQWVTAFSFTQDHREDVLLRSVTNNGVTQTIEYGNLDPSQLNSEFGQVYITSHGSTYPK